MKNNGLLLIILAVGAYFAWQKWFGPGAVISSGKSAPDSTLATSASNVSIAPQLASQGQGSGNLAPEAAYYTSVPLAYTPPTAPNQRAWWPVSYRIGARYGAMETIQ